MKNNLFLVVTLLMAQIALAQQGRFMRQMMERNFDRNAAPTTGPSPDYSNLYYWAASPHKHDVSDSIPAFLKAEQRDTLADVFFIHPTTFGTGIHSEVDASAPTQQRTNLLAELRNSAWNADLSDTALNRTTDLRPILYQASVFNGSCRVFAPRYRQASLKAFFVRNSPRAQQAFDLAYSDIKKAFQYYLDHDNHGRPIVIASHSQGSLHAIRLLQEFFDGKPLQQQLVCAYVVGYQIEKRAFKQLPCGDSPSATGCVVGWRSYQKGEIPRIIEEENGNSLCVNPLTWTSSAQWASNDQHRGALRGFNELLSHTVGAGIEPQSAILWVSLPNGIDDRLKRMKNLHVLDYNLFWMDIRENVRQRVQAFVERHKR
ncbi:DUF3089 domain-containing protein [Spirosoma gilvum]